MTAVNKTVSADNVTVNADRATSSAANATTQNAGLIKLDNSDYDTYENLLLRRDDCRKKAQLAELAYIREFGGLITLSFQKKIDCIAKKKSIEYYQAAANRGKKVNLDELDEYLRETMETYNRQLKDMLEDYEVSKKGKPVSENTIVQVKMIYRQIAKLIHPDTHPGVEENDDLNELWGQIVDAYRRNDLEMIQEMEILVHRALEESGEDAPEIVIPNIGERIAAVRAEIDRIITTDPYQYRFLLQDAGAVEEKKRGLQEEIDEYEEYENQLDLILQEYLKGGVILTWPMN